MRRYIVLAALLIATSSHALVLCHRQYSTIPRVREVCRPYETQLAVALEEAPATTTSTSTSSTTSSTTADAEVQDCFFVPVPAGVQISDVCLGSADGFCALGIWAAGDFTAVRNCWETAQGSGFQALCCPVR